MVYRSGGQKFVLVSHLLNLSVISDVVHSGKKYEREEEYWQRSNILHFMVFLTTGSEISCCPQMGLVTELLGISLRGFVEVSSECCPDCLRTGCCNMFGPVCLSICVYICKQTFWVRINISCQKFCSYQTLQSLKVSKWSFRNRLLDCPPPLG